MIFIKCHCYRLVCDLFIVNVSLTLGSLRAEPELFFVSSKSSAQLLISNVLQIYLYLFSTTMVMSFQPSFFHHIWPELDRVVCASSFMMCVVSTLAVFYVAASGLRFWRDQWEGFSVWWGEWFPFSGINQKDTGSMLKFVPTHYQTDGFLSLSRELKCLPTLSRSEVGWALLEVLLYRTLENLSWLEISSSVWPPNLVILILWICCHAGIFSSSYSEAVRTIGHLMALWSRAT